MKFARLWFLYLLAICQAYAKFECLATTKLPGKNKSNAAARIYRISPAYCPCKRICSSGCYDRKLCDNCRNNVCLNCMLMSKTTLNNNISLFGKCYDFCRKDLNGELRDPTEKFEVCALWTHPDDLTFIFRRASELDKKYPEYFSCKKACNNIEEDPKNKKTCEHCRKELCKDSGPCALAGVDFTSCKGACLAEFAYYSDLNPRSGCIPKVVLCDRPKIKFR